MFPVKINKKLLHCSKKQYWFQKNAKGTNVMITKTEFERWGIMLQTQVKLLYKNTGNICEDMNILFWDRISYRYNIFLYKSQRPSWVSFEKANARLPVPIGLVSSLPWIIIISHFVFFI